MLTFIVIFLGFTLALVEPSAKVSFGNLLRGMVPTLLALLFWKGRLTAEVVGLVCIFVHLFKVRVLNREMPSIPIVVGSLWPLAPNTIGLMASCWLAGIMIFRKSRVAELLWVLGGAYSLTIYQDTWLATVGILLVIIEMAIHIIKQWSWTQLQAKPLDFENGKRGELDETVLY